ncbi:protein of unknown function [Maridesulfovibrio hydrothermalis AM13 = DSM 14728]|uniref:Uncharacterized protein n=1 Tax=Maridesulfovibrio hydrothermalis AM13 = DSM 14728 TaxID=1121451 RepID=L0R988_9BACT|nr:protein of unknown function [Maridesulfovibrio hydrothermalis AM13 = DSM 14728]
MSRSKKLSNPCQELLGIAVMRLCRAQGLLRSEAFLDKKYYQLIIA